jgi:proline iminopeptidase
MMEMIVNGNQIYYEVHGNPKGDTIFFIHGAPGLGDCRGDIKSFQPLGDQYQLVFMDMRGSGRSDSNRPFTHQQWISDIEEVRKKLVGAPIIIFGGSYGGFLTLEYTLKYPDHVTHVLLRDTAASNKFNHLAIERALESDLPGVTEEKLRKLFDGSMESNQELKDMFGAILPLYTVENDTDAIKQKKDSIYYRYETHNFAFNHNLPNYNLEDKLMNITVPTLVTVGRHDWITPVICSEMIAERIPNSKLVIFENSGHSPQVEENASYLKILREFLVENVITNR